MKKQTKKKSTKKDLGYKSVWFPYEIIESEQKREERMREVEKKIRKVVGDKYVFILFEIEHIPKAGDYIEMGELKAIFRKKKVKK